MERRVNYKMEQPNVVIHSGIVETGSDEIELHSSHLHIETITLWITGINKAYYEQPKIEFEIEHMLTTNNRTIKKL